MTEDEFVAWCDEGVRAEWVDGEVIVMPPTSSRHNELIFFLGAVLTEFARSRGLGKVFGVEFTIRLPAFDQRRLPDLLFVAQERLHQLHPNHLEGAPDLVIEIVSPESLVRDWREKYLVYQAAQVREYWVIDPQARRFEVYALNEDGIYEVVREVEGRVSSGVVRGFYLKSEWLWQEPLPSTFDALREMGIIP